MYIKPINGRTPLFKKYKSKTLLSNLMLYTKLEVSILIFGSVLSLYNILINGILKTWQFDFAQLQYKPLQNAKKYV